MGFLRIVFILAVVDLALGFFISTSTKRLVTYSTQLSATSDSSVADAIVNFDQSAQNDPQQNSDDKEESIFDIVAGCAAVCLFESEKRRDAKSENVATPASATNWINDASAFALQNAFGRLELLEPDTRVGLDRDEAASWLRWMKSSPTQMIIDLSNELRKIANTTISDDNFDLIDLDREDFLDRLGCRLILFPSGARLSEPLIEPPASMIYGKVIFGGVSRYRRLTSSNSRQPPRKVGEYTAIYPAPEWIQYGGTERMYEAVDMGPAAIVEILVLPKSVISRGLGLPDLRKGQDMVLTKFPWKPQQIFGMKPEDKASQSKNNTTKLSLVTGYTPIEEAYGKDRNDAFESEFKESVGGLQHQIDAIVRRVLDGRVLQVSDDDDDYSNDDNGVLEAKELAVLGLTPVRGLLLYGPPGTGKTLLARQIARTLGARPPKIVSAPELLDRWVGGSERLVRNLFVDAESELAGCNGDATKSALHVLVIDEVDAVFRRRSSGEDSGEATRASVVNQILAKLDGINAIDNVLMIGMTNRRELLDEALLRPGRLEVQIEVPLPDKEGRREILQIHFDALRKRGRLSKPLCLAIDGVVRNPISGPQDQEVDEDVAETGKRKALKRSLIKAFHGTTRRASYDLAAHYATGGFSGADIAGLVRCAGSLALSRSRNDGNGVEGLLITLEDVREALKEVKQL